MTHTLLVTAISSLLLGFLFWGAVYLLGSRSRSQSALLFTATLTLLCFPVIVFFVHQRPWVVDEVKGLPLQSSAVDSGPEIMVPDVRGSGKEVVEEVIPVEVTSYQNEAVNASPALPVQPHTPVVIESSDSEVYAPLRVRSPEAEPVAGATEVVISARIQKMLGYGWIIWIVGAAIHGLYFLLQHVCFLKGSRCHSPIEDNDVLQSAQRIADGMGVRNLPELVYSNEPSPYCYGLIRRRLHLPSTLLENSTQTEMAMILRHELQHIRQYDLALLILQLPVRVIYWWNPLVTRLMKHFDYIRETLCDRAASQHSPDKYAHLLLHFASATSPSCRTVMSMASSAETMRARIKSLYCPQKKDLRITGLACAAIAVSVAFLLVLNVQIVSAHPEMDKTRPTDGKLSAVGALVNQASMQLVLQAKPDQRTRVAAGIKVPNNPVAVHYERYRQAQQALERLQFQGMGKNHPDVNAQRNLANKHSQLADQAVFDLLLLLQQSPEPAVGVRPVEGFQEYLKTLKSQPAEKQLSYAAGLPLSNNPALIYVIQRETLGSALQESLAGGLGRMHPTILGLQLRLDAYDDAGEMAALRATIDILNGNESRLSSEHIMRIFSLRNQIDKLLAAGLGAKHPSILVIEQEIQSWNEMEKK